MIEYLIDLIAEQSAREGTHPSISLAFCLAAGLGIGLIAP